MWLARTNDPSPVSAALAVVTAPPTHMSPTTVITVTRTPSRLTRRHPAVTADAALASEGAGGDAKDAVDAKGVVDANPAAGANVAPNGVIAMTRPLNELPLPFMRRTAHLHRRRTLRPKARPLPHYVGPTLR